jgi:hypothetical protein
MISIRHCGIADFDADMNLQKPDLADDILLFQTLHLDMIGLYQ